MSNSRLPASERIRAEIDEAFSSDRPLAEIMEEVARLGVRLLLQVALETEIDEFLGRGRYARGERTRPGARNGYSPVTIKTTAGPVTLARPKLRGTEDGFASRLLGSSVTRTNALESLVIAGFVRGLSMRDLEATLEEALGPEARLSKSTASRICASIKDEFAAWVRRDLSGIELEYLYLDASCFRMHPGARAEPLLAAWGITTEGKKVLVGMGVGAAESYEAWHDFLRDLRGRGLRPALLAITDGAPGLILALQEVFPESLRQRCLVHRARNLVAKVPAHAQAEVKAAFWAIFNGIEAAPGDEAMAEAKRRARAFERRWVKLYPTAVACVTDSLPELCAHLRFPREHWERIRHTNLLERTFGESRRRVKVIGRLPGEESCTSLVWAVLDRASRGWRGLTQTPAGLRRLQNLRHELLPEKLKEVVAENREIVTPAA